MSQALGIGEAGGTRRERKPQRLAAASAGRATAASVVQDELRREILDMVLRPGVALSEKDLTTRFGISRTPVREALIRLKEEGLVEIFPQAGTFVARIPAGAIPEAVFIRQALECATVEVLARMASADDIARLDATIAVLHESHEANDQERFHLADEEFHEALADIAGYPGVWKLAQAAKSQIDRCRRMTLPVPGRMAMVIREHLAIVDEIRRHDASAAVVAMRQHLGTLLPDLVHLKASYPDYFV
ncbi:DNA-binding GntR family transcriptional regulator [Bosea sp. 62]|uniref:GntR family transcriptional regulator n=1 Tax=unclassified Bosea (in: a-proteobacteria) TaxID=2653178 RepID=UPI001253A967|nr:MULTISPECIES: GntR family transcriptional regulator [unclassified Bosea (in: a-proteobacteria)]CAD5250041.1 DNA-binding GntR family transcriptional regulator [Bosea sp. 46]CAD5250596.1 DNA-binding GntR family transcriptional regulator [Bosea sp. 21B]CAD5263798.1 DNA-binding GntR family transcriptional regulator [Bosea sp. 7B]VVT44037.1 DNA-binding transcriptional regulator, GntR family [Bosea sp. EC-HK365B]VXB14408.1 DNA-binding GntR family transcriptional regulator [Bosea sp. 29B]